MRQWSAVLALALGMPMPMGMGPASTVVMPAMALAAPAPKANPKAKTAPPAAAGWKTIDLVGATCAAVAPGPLTFRIPPGFVVRTSAKGLTAGCLWGDPQDLALVLGEPEATFDRVERGVFQARPTTTLGYDAASKKFEDEENLPHLFERAGVAGASVERRTLGGAPALVVSGRGPNGGPLHLLYLAIVRGSVAEVLIVSFHAPVNGADREETWKMFLAGVRAEK